MSRSGYWDGTEVVERESTPRTARPFGRPLPTIEPLEDSGEFREWFRTKYGKDPVTLAAV